MSRRRFEGVLHIAPAIAMLALAGGLVIKSFGGDIISSINSSRIEKELSDMNSSTSYYSSASEVVFDNEFEDNIIEETTEDEPVEEEQEEIQEVQRQISDELLTSGYEFQNINFAELSERNNEIDAWIEIQGTSIDYPIMHAPERDNPETGEYYYLHHDFDHNESKNGVPFLFGGNNSLNCDQEDLNPVSLIFAHHMASGAMFAQLFNYSNQSYYDEHPFAVVYTPDGYAYKVSFFAGVITGTKTSESIDVSSEELFNEFIANAKEHSTFTSDVEVEYGDNLMILYTCEYTGGKNSKYMLYGIVEKQYTNELQIGNNDSDLGVTSNQRRLIK